MDRREFISHATLASLALCAACAGAGAGDATGPTLSVGGTVKISDYPALANVNGVATFDLSGTPIAVVRTGQSTFLVLSRFCPHQGGTIQSTSSGFQCPVHGAIFSRTGTWTGGERTSNMRTISSTYDATTDTLTIG